MRSLSVRVKEKMTPIIGEKNSGQNIGLEPYDKNPILSKGFSIKPVFILKTLYMMYKISIRYDIMKKIGDGNFAVVHKCRMKNTQSEFAMKIIDKGIMKGKVNY